MTSPLPPLRLLALALLTPLLAACLEETDPDGQARALSFDTPRLAEGDTGTRTLRFEVTSAVAQTIEYHTRDITAAAGSDYLETEGRWSFSAGQTRTLEISVLGDTQIEATERLGLVLTFEDGSSRTIEGVIENDDFPGLSVADANLTEGDEGTRTLTFDLQLEDRTRDPLPLRVRTADTGGAADAEAGVDYQPVDEEVEVAEDSDALSIDVAVVGDTRVESDETFELLIESVDGQSLTSAIGTIRDDDNTLDIEFVDTEVSRAEGDAGETREWVFEASVSGSGDAQDLNYRVRADDDGDRPATIGEDDDLPASEGQLTLGPGESGEIRIPVRGDGDFEADETFRVELGNDEGVVFDTATGVIENDDAPDVSVTMRCEVADPCGVNEGDDTDDKRIEFELEVLGSLTGDLTVGYETQNGEYDDVDSAETSDYESINNQELTFSKNDRSRVVSVDIKGDDDYEADEAFDLVVTSDGSGEVEYGRGTGRILNDDPPEIELRALAQEREEGDAGDDRPFRLHARLADSATTLETFYYTTVDGTARGSGAQADYGGQQARQIDIERGDFASDPFTIHIHGDGRIEDDEDFRVLLYDTEEDAEQAEEDSAVAEITLTIENDDRIEVGLSNDKLSFDEGNPDSPGGIKEQPLADLLPEPLQIVVSGAELDEDLDVELCLEPDPGGGVGIHVNDPDEPDDIRLDDTCQTVVVPEGDYSTTPAEVEVGAEDIRVVSDDRVESDEVFELAISDALYDDDDITERDPTYTRLTLVNDDVLRVGFDGDESGPDPEGTPQALPALVSGNDLADDYDGGPLEVELSLTGGDAEEADFATLLPLVVDLTDPDGDGDLDAFDAGTRFENLLAVEDDDLIEETETAELALEAHDADPDVEIDASADQYSYRIEDNDALGIRFSAADLSAIEGDPDTAGGTTARALVDQLVTGEEPPALIVSGAELQEDITVTLDYDLDPGGGTGLDGGDQDDIALGGDSDEVTITAGDYTTSDGTFEIDGIDILSDDRVESDEIFTIALADGLDEDLSLVDPKDMTVTIENDDALEVAFVGTATGPHPEDDSMSVPSLTTRNDLDADYDGADPSVEIELLADSDAEEADFETMPATVEFEPPFEAGEERASGLVIEDDDLVEETELAELVLASPSDDVSIDAGADRFDYEIEDNDALNIRFSAASLSVDEGDPDTAGDTTGRALVDQLAAGEEPPALIVSGAELQEDITVALDYDLAPGGGTGLDGGGKDDIALGGDSDEVTITAGDYTDSDGTFGIDGIDILSDDRVESDEVFSIALAAGLDADLSPATPQAMTVTIANDDDLEVAFVGTATGPHPEDDSTAVPALTTRNDLDADYDGADPSVEIELGGGTAETVDFAKLPLTVEFTPPFTAGEERASGLVVEDDDLVEETELAELVLGEPSADVSIDADADRFDYEIEDDDRLTATLVDGASYTWVEDETVPDTARPVVRISGGILDDDSPELGLDLVFEDDTATRGDDYVVDVDRLTLDTRDYTDEVEVRLDKKHLDVIDDEVLEADEAFEVGLADVESALSDHLENSNPAARAGITIESEDELSVRFRDADQSLTEGDLDEALVVEFDGAELEETLTLSLAVGGTATRDDDYTLDEDELELSAGDYSGASGEADLTLSVQDDDRVENDETVVLAFDDLTTAGGDAIGPVDFGGDRTVTIANDDALSVDFDATTAQGGEDDGPIDLPLTISGETDIDVDVSISNQPLGDYPVDRNDDLGAIESELAIKAGDAYPTALSVEPTDDNEVEFHETLRLTIEESGRVTSAEPDLDLRLLDDDAKAWINGSNTDFCLDGNGDEAGCDGLGAPLDSQDGALGQSVDLNGSVDGDAHCIEDQRTGLSWLLVDEGVKDAATVDGDADNESRCERNDWRRPTLAELFNLMDFSDGETGLIDTTVFDGIAVSDGDAYWAAGDAAGQDWTLSFHDGALVEADGDTEAHALLVSDAGADQPVEPPGEDARYACTALDESAPPADLTSDHRYALTEPGGDWLVSDVLSGLTWSARAQGTTGDWEDGLQAALDADDGGASDWRAPTIKELLSLLYFGCDDDTGALTDHRLSAHFLPLADDANEPLPLMSATPVADTGTPGDIWAIDLAPDSAGHFLVRQAPPSASTPMQIFLVRSPD